MLSNRIYNTLSLSLSLWFTLVIKFNNSTIARNSSCAPAHCERSSLPTSSPEVSSGRALCACHNISLKSFRYDADKALRLVRCDRGGRDEKIFCAVFHGYYLLSRDIPGGSLVAVTYIFRPIHYLTIISAWRLFYKLAGLRF